MKCVGLIRMGNAGRICMSIRYVSHLLGLICFFILVPRVGQVAVGDCEFFSWNCIHGCLIRNLLVSSGYLCRGSLRSEVVRNV